ncbi:MAG: hypothetical protein Q4C91_15065 [Eubacteriales bacterium]|nr:hypothetical protein [Eubacteriales bacterium]
MNTKGKINLASALLFLAIFCRSVSVISAAPAGAPEEQQLSGNFSASLSELSDSASGPSDGDDTSDDGGTSDGNGTSDGDDIEEWEDGWDYEAEDFAPAIGQEGNFSVFTDTPSQLPDDDPAAGNDPAINNNPAADNDPTTNNDPAADGTSNDPAGISPANTYPSGGGASSGGAVREEVLRKPKLLLESSSLSEKELTPGSSEKLDVTLRNKSPRQSIYNLKISLSNASGELQLTRNSFYYEKVNPGAGICLSENIKISGSVKSVCVPLVFTFSYEDSKGNEISDTENLNLMISQPLRMELEAASVPELLYASETVEIPVKAVNPGRTQACNVRITLSAPGLFPKEEAFLGTIEAGTAGEGTLRVYVGTRTMESIGNDPGTADTEKYGSITGKFILRYEDESGTSYETEADFQSEIKKAQILSLKVEEEQPNSWWISVLAVVFLALLAVIVLLIRLIRRKNILLEEARKERNPQNAT